MSSIEDVHVKQLRMPFETISSATNRFHKENLIGRGGFGHVYIGDTKEHGLIAVKRLDDLDPIFRQGECEFKAEISLLSKFKHENIVSLVGFCDENGEKILVYRYESNGSLDKHLHKKDLTWIQRLQICLDAAIGLMYVHENTDSQPGIYHRDIKSANILLDDKWKAKISDFGLSRFQSLINSFVITNPCGTDQYIDPCYISDGILSPKSDVYSFGVVLCEVVCGRLAKMSIYKNEKLNFAMFVKKHYEKGTLLEEIVPSYLRKQINLDSFNTFTKIVYECLKGIEDRPTMKQVVEQLQQTLHNQQLEEEKKDENEAKPAPSKDQKKGKKLKDPRPPPPPQEVVLDVYMHCEDCARRVRKCLKHLEGVEGVSTDCDKHLVVVKGEKADPLTVLERVKKETRRQVTLLTPVVPKPTVNKKKKDKEPRVPKPTENKDKKDKQPSRTTMVMEALPKAYEAPVMDTILEEVETPVLDQKISQLDAKVDHTHEKTVNNNNISTVIVNQDPTLTAVKKIERINDDAEEKPDENQLLWALKIFGFCLFLACEFVLGAFCRWLLQLYDIPNEESIGHCKTTKRKKPINDK